MSSLKVTNKSVVSSTLPQPADIGGAVQKLRSLSQDWATELAGALERLQDHATTISKYLRQNPPQTTKIIVTDPTTGQTVAVLGTYIPNNTGVPITNYFSEITIADDPDPTKATVITLQSGLFQILAPSTATAVTLNLAMGGAGSVSAHVAPTLSSLSVSAAGGNQFFIDSGAAGSGASVDGFVGFTGTKAPVNSITVHGGVVTNVT